jgi:chorismate synthase
MGFGTRLKVTLFGSSHGPEVGVVVDGFPAGVPVREGDIQADLDRRSPVGRRTATKRQEPDRLVLESGVSGGLSTGGAIRAHVANEDVDRSVYERLRWTPRPGHADYPARERYGDSADLSGGGIFSGRMTVGLVIAGALARGVLEPRGIEAVAFTRSIGTIQFDPDLDTPIPSLRENSEQNEIGCPDPATAVQMEAAIGAARREGDSLGGVIECRVSGVPVGLGEPFFDSVESEIAHLAFSIPAVKGVEFGDGFAAASRRGSQHNDPFYWDGDRVRTRTNHSGGILGGLTTGDPVVFRVAVKPTSSIARPQETVDLRTRTRAEIVVGGRHDPCIVPRAVVVVESIARLAIADLGLRGGFR